MRFFFWSGLLASVRDVCPPFCVLLFFSKRDYLILRFFVRIAPSQFLGSFLGSFPPFLPDAWPWVPSSTAPPSPTWSPAGFPPPIFKGFPPFSPSPHFELCNLLTGLLPSSTFTTFSIGPVTCPITVSFKILILLPPEGLLSHLPIFPPPVLYCLRRRTLFPIIRAPLYCRLFSITSSLTFFRFHPRVTPPFPFRSTDHRRHNC